jgi:ankyrin repeat protein
MIQRGASTEEGSGVNNWTPLQHAVHKNQARAAFALIDAGAKPDSTRGDVTPLMMAAGYGQEEIVRGLLRRGADPMRVNTKDESALDLALSGVGCQTGTVAELVKHAPQLARSASVSAQLKRLTKTCPEMRRILDAL